MKISKKLIVITIITSSLFFSLSCSISKNAKLDNKNSKIIKFKDRKKVYEAGSVYVYRGYSDSNLKRRINFYFLLLISKEDIGKFMKFIESSDKNRFLESFQAKFSEKNNDKLVAITLDIVYYLDNKKDLNIELEDSSNWSDGVAIYSLGCKNFDITFNYMSKEFKKQFKKNYNLEELGQPSQYMSKVLTSMSTIKKCRNKKSLELGSSLLTVSNVASKEDFIQLYSPNIGCVAVLENSKFGHLRKGKHNLYKDFKGKFPIITLCLYIPSKNSEDKFWYDDSIIDYQRGKLYLRETSTARWWK